MENGMSETVQLSKGINMRDLLKPEMEFHIDMDFKKNPEINLDDDLFPDTDDGSESEDVLKNIETSTNKMMLSSPEYHSFEKLSAMMVDCISSGDAKILIIEEGDGPLVPYDADVKIHYAAYWEKARIPFDSTLTMGSGEPMRIRLGDGQILPGLEIGLTTVRGPTARFHLLLQPRLAWGEKGIPPRILPQPVLFVIALYDVRDAYAGARFNDLPSEEQSKFEITMKTVKSLHSVAKDLFNKKKYKAAIKNYQQSMNVLTLSQPKTEEEVAEIKKMKVTVYVNLVVCYYKINKPKYVINMCKNLDYIIDIDTHCKALYYYGKAYYALGKTEEALLYYKKALKLEPRNKTIGKTLAELDLYTKVAMENEKEMWQAAMQSKPVEKKVVYDIDEQFRNSAREMCNDLAGRDDYAKFDLPTGLTRNEIDFLKDLVKDFQSLVVQEDGNGKRKKVSIIKKIA